jgi:hypothetical protein
VSLGAAVAKLLLVQLGSREVHLLDRARKDIFWLQKLVMPWGRLVAMAISLVQR